MFIGARDESKRVWNKVGCELTACQLCCDNKNNYEKEVRSLAWSRELLLCWKFTILLAYSVDFLLEVHPVNLFFELLLEDTADMDKSKRK